MDNYISIFDVDLVLFFTAKLTIIRLYHGGNKLLLVMMLISDL